MRAAEWGQDEPGWYRLSSHIWPGVKLYTGIGPNKGYVAEIVDFDDHHREIDFDGTIREFRGIRLLYPSGELEWKDRSAFIRKPYLFVRMDDPALPSFQRRTSSP